MELEGGLREGCRDRFNKQKTLKCKGSNKKVGGLAIDVSTSEGMISQSSEWSLVCASPNTK